MISQVDVVKVPLLVYLFSASSGKKIWWFTVNLPHKSGFSAEFPS
jgi:hypothetical protein